MAGATLEVQDDARRRDVRAWALGLALVVGCSWARRAATGSLRVDQSYPSEAAGTAILAVLVLGWALLLWGWKGLLTRPPARPRRLAFAGLAIASAMLPMLSNDVFSLFAYGSLAARGADVYTTARSLASSPWYAWVGEMWRSKVCVYGPTTLVATLPAALAGTSAGLGILLYRLFWLVPVAVVMELSFRRMADEPFFHAMVWLNPLWLVEGPGQLHADLLGMAAVVAGILLQRSGRDRSAAVPYAGALLGKYSFVFAAPWFVLRGATTLPARAARAAVVLASIAGLGVVFYAPFWRGTATLTEPVRALAGMNAGGSIADVAGQLVAIVRTGHLPSATTPVADAVAFDQATKHATWAVVTTALQVVSLVVGVRVLWTVLRKPEDERRLALGTGALVVAALTLASPRFEPWYLLAALPFFGLSCPRIWQRWWVVAVAATVAVDFTNVLPRSAVALPVVLGLSTAGAMVAFVMSPVKRYWDLGIAEGGP